MTQQGHLVDWY